MVRLRMRVTKKERKYNLICPFWVETVVEALIRERAIDLGRTFSSQLRSSSRKAVFWPAARFVSGNRWCMMVGRYPKELENLNGFDACLSVRFWVMRLSSSATMKPSRVTIRAVNLRWKGMAIGGTIAGGML